MDKRKGMFEEKFAQAITMLPAVFSLNGWSSNIVNPINEGWESETWGGAQESMILTAH